MQSSMAPIPNDVISEILCRLPVKTLLRFRCVSKQFRTIIDGPDFINHHLKNHHSLNRKRLIVEGKHSNLVSVDLDSADNVFKPELPFESGDSGFRVIGSCDGLLALSLYRHASICLWNISTRKHQILPKFWSDIDMYDYIFDGFGYDAATDDYKWVRVISDRNYRTEVTVFSLKANSWRRIENYPPYHNYTVNDMGVLVGGALNWEVGVIDIDESRIMSFDLKGEKFYEVSLPDTADVAEADAEFHIVVLDGCLCLSYLYPFEIALDVWVMKEYGVKESWTKLFRLSEETLHARGNLYYRTAAFACLKSSDKVLVYQANGEVFWHELDRKTDENVEINGWPNYIKCATIYIDSLVSPRVGL